MVRIILKKVYVSDICYIEGLKELCRDPFKG
jgi:hypothetical protein